MACIFHHTIMCWMVEEAVWVLSAVVGPCLCIDTTYEVFALLQYILLILITLCYILSSWEASS